MKQTIPPLSKLLLPVKDFDLFRNTLPLLTIFSQANNSTSLHSIDLLHVVGGSFLCSHLANIDLRADHMVSSDTITRLREDHVEKMVNPLLDRVQEVLNKSSIDITAQIRVAEGDPVKKICEICDTEEYSTLVMARRKEDDESFFSGSVVNGVLGRFLESSIYLVGENGFPDNSSVVARTLIGVDGSPASIKAVEEAGMLLGRCGDTVEKVSLINVLDQSCFFGENRLKCQEASETAYGQMDRAEKILTREGVKKECIEATVLFGHPGEMLIRHARDFDATLTYIGRRDRSKISEVLLGSVCSDIVHKLRDRALILVS